MNHGRTGIVRSPKATGGGGGSGTVTSVAAGDASVTVGGTPTVAPTIETADIATITGLHAVSGDWSNNSHKITSLANGSGAQDAAAFGQVPTLLVPTAVKSSAYGAAVGNLVPCDVSGGSFTVTLPTAPADKSQICIEVVNRVTTGAPTYVTVAAGGSDVFFRASGPTSVLQGVGSTILQYAASPAIWYTPGLTGAGTTSLLPSGWEFGYDQITAGVDIASTTQSAGTTIISCGAHIFDGSPVLGEFSSPQCSTDTAGGFFAVSLFESSTQIGALVIMNSVAAAAQSAGLSGRIRFSPSAGSHTYTVTAYSNTAAATKANIGAGAGGTGALTPAFMRFTKA